MDFNKFILHHKVGGLFIFTNSMNLPLDPVLVETLVTHCSTSWSAVSAYIANYFST